MHLFEQAKEGKSKKEEQFRDVVGDGTLKVCMFPQPSIPNPNLRTSEPEFLVLHRQHLAVFDSFADNKSAAHRDKSREWGRLKEKVEPLIS